MPRKSRGLRKRALALVVALIVFAALWQSGVVGQFAGRVLFPAVLPWTLSREVEISRFSYTEPVEPSARGVTVTVSAGRLKEMLADAVPWSRFLPPGLLRPGTVIEGTWYPSAFYLPPEGHMPLMVVIDSESRRPHVLCRYPADDVNRVMEREVAEALREREEYVLGSYETVYYIRFKQLHIKSDNAPLDGPVKRRSLDVRATGRVRFVLEENWFDLRNTGKLRILHGVIDLDVGEDEKGIYTSHKVDIDKLDINFHNVAPWLDEKLSEKLRKKWTRSLNKEKKRRRMESRRLPHWAPVDLVLDLELFSAPETAQ